MLEERQRRLYLGRNQGGLPASTSPAVHDRYRSTGASQAGYLQLRARLFLTRGWLCAMDCYCKDPHQNIRENASQKP